MTGPLITAATEAARVLQAAGCQALVADHRAATPGGGLLACAAGGRLCIDNTLEKRLARGWDDLLPALCRDLEEHAAADPGPR